LFFFPESGPSRFRCTPKPIDQLTHGGPELDLGPPVHLACQCPPVRQTFFPLSFLRKPLFPLVKETLAKKKQNLFPLENETFVLLPSKIISSSTPQVIHPIMEYLVPALTMLALTTMISREGGVRQHLAIPRRGEPIYPSIQKPSSDER